MTMTDLGYGRYRDKDYDPNGSGGCRGFWEHAEEGWRWYSGMDDVNPGEWHRWANVKQYAPFTPMLNPGGVIAPAFTEAASVLECEPSDFEVRKAALELAVQVACSMGGVPSAEILEGAREFEEYLRGGE